MDKCNIELLERRIKDLEAKFDKHNGASINGDYKALEKTSTEKARPKILTL